jgi:dolichyl-phosphate beta-glucosyltransferase
MPNRLCLVIPCFNESKRLSKDYLQQLRRDLSCDLVFVDDGSVDDTFTWLRTNFEDCTVIQLPKNEGKARAVAIGLRQTFSDYDFTAVCDADGAISIEDWKTAKSILEENDDLNLVSGARVLLAGMPIRRGSTRKWIGRIIATYICFILTMQIYDPQSPCKIYRRDFLQSIDFSSFRSRWFFDAEMLLQSPPHSILMREFALLNWHDVPGSHLKLSSFFEVLRDILLLFKLKSIRKK